jgi:hypothetical protein
MQGQTTPFPSTQHVDLFNNKKTKKKKIKKKKKRRRRRETTKLKLK